MALETLLNSQREASMLMDVPFEEVMEYQKPYLAMEGTIDVDGTEVWCARAHSGPDDGRKAKGGIRKACYGTLIEARADVEELSVEMLSKLALRNLTKNWRGGKGIMAVPRRRLSHEENQYLADAYEGRMEDADIAGHDKDVPAGDVGTNGLADDYALARKRRNPGDPYWQASITGKDPRHGGHPFRKMATSWGTYVSQATLMGVQGFDGVATTTVRGAGAVGGWEGYFVSQDPTMRLGAISDIGGVLYTDTPEGIIITERMAAEVCDNQKFIGDKIDELGRRITANQPNIDLRHKSLSEADIATFPTHYFVPAAIGDAITATNAPHLGASHGVIEGQNGPTTPEAQGYLTLHRPDLIIYPDIGANGEGVLCSTEEWEANVALVEGRIEAMPSTQAMQQLLRSSSERTLHNILAMSRELGTTDLRVAAAGLAIANMLRPDLVVQRA